MQIGCTKKLIDEAGIIPEAASEERDLFSWSAHLITVNRKKTLVVVNDSNRFGFILYGMKAKDFKQLKELIHKGMYDCLIDEKIKPEVIAHYMSAAGDIAFVKTRGAKYVSRLNKACIWAESFGDEMNPEGLYQRNVSSIMNSDYIKISKEVDFEQPYELMKRDLESFYGGEIISCKAVELLIELYLGSYTAWRKIITPADTTFRQFHKILQIVFDWKNYHLYDFIIPDESGKPILRIVSDKEEDYGFSQNCDVKLDTEVQLSDVIRKENKMLYRYDFGDNWEHTITLTAFVQDYNKNYPVCLQGDGNAPPEDVGGIPGYQEYLNIISDPANKEYKSTREWASGQWYKDFDIKIANNRLKSVLRKR